MLSTVQLTKAAFFRGECERRATGRAVRAVTFADEVLHLVRVVQKLVPRDLHGASCNKVALPHALTGQGKQVVDRAAYCRAGKIRPIR